MKGILKKIFSLQVILLMLNEPFLSVQAADEVPVYDNDVDYNTEELLEELRYGNWAEDKRTVRYLVPINASVVSGNSNLMTGLGEILGIFYQLATPGSGLTRNIYAEAMGYAEDELGIDKDMIRRAAQKIPAPTVDVIFDNTAPKEGEKVTASALVQNFKNTADNLYYTWFIIHTDEKGKPLNGIEDGKKEAMGIVARGSFDPVLYDIDYTEETDGNRDAFKAPIGGGDGVGAKKSECGDCDGDCECLSDSDGCVRCFDDRGEPMFYGFDIKDNKDWFENTGRETWALDERINNESKRIARTEAISRCYKRNFGKKGKKGEEYSGRDLIVKCEHQFPKCDGEVGDGDFGLKEEKCWRTHPENADTDGDGVMDEADLAGLGQKSITWNYRKGDRIGVLVEGTSNIQINEGTTDRLRQKRAYADPDLSRPDQQEEYEKKLAECEALKSIGYKVEFPEGALEADGLNEPDYSSPDYHHEGPRLDITGFVSQTYYTCMKRLWSFNKDSSIDPQGDMTVYNKIMSAGLDICTDEEIEFLDDDGCDEKDDIGFTYLATVPVEEAYDKIYEVNVLTSPKNPQLNTEDADSTDTILARAVITDSEVNPDTVYYKWRILRCDPVKFDECREDVTDTADTFDGASGPFEGLGVKEIAFKPTEKTFEVGKKKAMLKVVAVVWKGRNSELTSPSIGATYEEDEVRMLIDKGAQASQLVPVTKNDMSIKLFSYQARNGVWTDPWKICGKGLYKRVCPVYPYQVIGAYVEDGDSGDVSGYTWSINGNKITAPDLPLDKCMKLFPENGDLYCKGNEANYKFGQMIYFPVLGDDYEIFNLSVTAERLNPDEGITDDDIVAERFFSVNKPNAILKFSDNVKLEKSAQGTFEEMFKVMAGEKFEVEATIVPHYLDEHFEENLLPIDKEANRKEVSIEWSLGGSKLLGEINDREIRDLDFSDWQPGIRKLQARVLKNFSDEYLGLLSDSWGIQGVAELIDDKDVQLRFYKDEKPYDEYGYYGYGDTASIGGFFASTAANAPYYLLFILRISITLVLLGAIFFGLAYAMGSRKIIISEEQFRKLK